MKEGEEYENRFCTQPGLWIALMNSFWVGEKGISPW